jgi:Mrp family chromosome partitioning ATPase
MDDANRLSSSPTLCTSLSVKDIVDEIAQHLPHQNNESRKPFRVISEDAEEPFIVPFSKPEPFHEEVEHENVMVLKGVTESVPPVLLSKSFSRHWQYRRKPDVPYRKPMPIPPIADVPTEEASVSEEPTPPIDISTFQWSSALESLKQSAHNQTRMLTDHLVVQSNQGVKTICFKSVFPGDGCSTILLCAARALIERQHRILLIDAHHRHINLQAQLNLSGNLDSGNAVIGLNDHFGFWVWQESRTVEKNMELLTEVLSTHHEEYDLILLDCGSLTESPLPEFVEFWDRIEADGIILVSNMKHPPEIPMSHIAGRLRRHHIHLIGITENYV